MKMRKPKYPGELLKRAKEGKSVYKHKKHHHKVDYEKSAMDKAVDKATGFKEGSKKDMAVDKAVQEHMHKHKKAKLGSGKRFATLKGKLAKKPGVKNPGAIAASIGVKKFGQKKMTSMAVKGRKRAAKK